MFCVFTPLLACLTNRKQYIDQYVIYLTWFIVRFRRSLVASVRAFCCGLTRYRFGYNVPKKLYKWFNSYIMYYHEIMYSFEDCDFVTLHHSAVYRKHQIIHFDHYYDFVYILSLLSIRDRWYNYLTTVQYILLL